MKIDKMSYEEVWEALEPYIDALDNKNSNWQSYVLELIMFSDWKNEYITDQLRDAILIELKDALKELTTNWEIEHSTSQITHKWTELVRK